MKILIIILYVVFISTLTHAKKKEIKVQLNQEQYFKLENKFYSDDNDIPIKIVSLDIC